MSDGARFCPVCGEPATDGARFCAKDGSPLVAVGPDPMIGRVLAGRLRLDERLGRGGMGTVYRAHQLSVGRDVAVKLIDARLAADPDGARRFLREARLASRLRHPGTALIIDFGQEGDGVLWLAMTLIPGRTLAELIASGGPMAPRRALGLIRQLTAVLVDAHSLGVLHRDLKPANVMVGDGPAGEERVTLLDFGIARSLTDVDDSTITRSGTVCGTVAYMAPEVACGEPAEPRSDLYSLGVMLYELLAGTRPFEHERADVVMRMHVTEDPPAIAHVPAVIESLVMRCLAKEPSGRFKDAVHLLAALDAALDAAPDGISGAPLTQDHAKVVPATATGERVLSISAPTADETTPQRPARRWWPWAAAALAIGVAIASWPRETPPAPVVTQPPAVAPAAPPPTVAPIVVARVPEAEARAETRSITAIYEAPPVPSADVRAPPKPATRPTKPRPERVAPEPAFIIPGG